MRKEFMGVVFVILSLFIVGCGYFLLKGLLNIQRSIASEKWPKTTGQVISSETSKNLAPGPGRGRTETFNTRTVVRYTANGQQYETDVEHFGQTFGSGDASEAAVKLFRYPVGKAVSVFYDPRSPAVGVLHPGLHAEAFWLVGASLAFAIPVALALLFVTRMNPSTALRENPAFQEQVQRAVDQRARGGNPVRVEIPLERPIGIDSSMALMAGFMGLVFCSLGLLALTAGMQRYWNAKASVAWPTTDATIVSAAKTSDDDEKGLDEGTDTSWFARFVYRYTVNGVEYFNNRRRFAGIENGNDSRGISSLREAYEKGQPVKVSYAPSDPNLSVLSPGITEDSYVLPVIGGALILFATLIFVFMMPSLLR